MDLEDKFLVKASGIQSLSSSLQSTPGKNGQSDEASRTPEFQEFLKSAPKKEILRSFSDKDRKQSASSKRKMKFQQTNSNNTSQNHESKKASLSPSGLASRKQNRKGEAPMRFLPPAELTPEFGFSSSWICKNSACRARLSMDDTFCRRCSCCICHLYDDNKDPSLWLVCSSESDQGDSCGLSCHIECALREKKVGVVDLGQFMHLDGSYCCASCGKVSGIVGCWKKQLVIAKDARRVDVLCHRIYLSYKLLDGTTKFKELHDIVTNAKDKLETEVGLLGGFTANMARGIVSRLPVARDIVKLCSQAIEKADEWLTCVSDVNQNGRDSLPAACRFLFEEVKPSSVVIILIEMPTSLSEDIKGYKLWYCKSRDETHTKEPVCIFPRSQRRIMISHLQPCTEYNFRIVSYTEFGDLGHSEVRCFTKSVEIIHKNFDSAPAMNQKEENPKKITNGVGPSSGFKVRNLGKIFRVGQAQKQGVLDGLCAAEMGKCNKVGKAETKEEQLAVVGCGAVPDLNEELTPPLESSGDEVGISQDSQTGERKRGGSVNESDSTLINVSQSQNSDGLDDNFEYCVKIIRWVECEGHMMKEFRLKLLTWLSLRANEQERRVVNTFIQTLIDDPTSLAGQLVDSFSDIISGNRH